MATRAFSLQRLYTMLGAMTAEDMQKIAEMVDEADDAVDLCSRCSEKYNHELTTGQAQAVMDERDNS